MVFHLLQEIVRQMLILLKTGPLTQQDQAILNIVSLQILGPYLNKDQYLIYHLKREDQGLEF